MRRLNSVFFLLGLIFLIVTIVKLGAGEILSSILAVGAWFLPIVGVNLLWYSANALGWFEVYRKLGSQEPGGQAPGPFRFILAMVAGEAINNATPFFNLGGEPVKGMLAGRSAGDVGRVVSSLIVDNTVNYIASTCFIAAGLFVSLFILELDPALKIGLIVSITFISATLYLFFWLQTRGHLVASAIRVLKALKRESDSRIAKLKRMDDEIQSFYSTRKNAFFLSFGLHLFARIIATFDALFILYIMGIEIDLLTAFFIQTISVLINLAFTFIPLQIGVAEGGHYVLFLALGIDPVHGVLFSLIRRIRGIIWIVIGLIIMLLSGKRVEPEAAQA